MTAMIRGEIIYSCGRLMDKRSVRTSTRLLADGLAHVDHQSFVEGCYVCDLIQRLTESEAENERLKQDLWKCQEQRDTMMTVTDRDWTRTLLQQNEELDRLRAALQDEHFRSNGVSVYMDGPPQHERSIARCQHPLCLVLNRSKDG